MKKDLVCQEDFDLMDFDLKIWSALPIIVRLMYRVGCLFEKADHLLVESPGKRAFLITIQAGISCRHLFHDAY